MRRIGLAISLLTVLFSGCADGYRSGHDARLDFRIKAGPVADRSPEADTGQDHDVATRDEFHPTVSLQSCAEFQSLAESQRRRELVQTVKPFFIEGTYYPSGRMGDAENPKGPLRHEICTEGFLTPPTCEKWIYTAPAEGPEQSWVGVAYQWPANNWGSQRGMNLSGMGFSRLTFAARGEVGGEKVLVRSGGCTSLGASFAASHEAAIGVIVLKPTWERFEVPLDGCDLSSVPAIFSFTVDRAMASDGCTFYIDDIALRGMGD